MLIIGILHGYEIGCSSFLLPVLHSDYRKLLNNDWIPWGLLFACSFSKPTACCVYCVVCGGSRIPVSCCTRCTSVWSGLNGPILERADRIPPPPFNFLHCRLTSTISSLANSFSSNSQIYFFSRPCRMHSGYISREAALSRRKIYHKTLLSWRQWNTRKIIVEYSLHLTSMKGTNSKISFKYAKV
jgi:hypothetical protein